MKISTALGGLIVGGILASSLSPTTNAQTNLNFTQVKATSEGAIQLFWNSTTNEFYRIDYADELVDTNTGYITWVPLYSDYPSHGTNTFVADCGNYDLTPEIPHPKYTTQRFYRIALMGTNTSPTNPIVSIISPTNGATLSGNVSITVTSSSPEMLISTSLYIDGEEQWPSDDLGAKWTINTCEWPNGPHTLFAVARSMSGYAVVPEDNSITFGRAVSPYVNVVFSNLISRFDFSQRAFEPELGQTQTVTATFAANVNWTIEVKNDATNTVRSTNGVGASMLWNFDGTGYGGTNLPGGHYWYVLTVQTNGLPIPPPDYGGGDTNPPPTPGGSYTVSSSTSDWYPTSESQAIAAGWDHWYVKHPPMPPVYTNGAWHGWEDVYGPLPLFEFQVPESTQQEYNLSSSSETYGAEAWGGDAAQTTQGPTRKDKEQRISKTGTFGVAWDSFPQGIDCLPPLSGYPVSPRYIKIDGLPLGSRLQAGPQMQFGLIATFFASNMKAMNSGYSQTFAYDSTKWSPSSISGSGGIFNGVNLGLLVTHGSYAETQDTQFTLNTYLWHDSGTYARLRDLQLGSPGTNGLRWMTLATCSPQRPACVSSMKSRGFFGSIITGDLHLLLGMETSIYHSPLTGAMYATNLVAGQTLYTSWVNALSNGIAFGTSKPPLNTNVTARVDGWASCFNDTLHAFYDPDTGPGLDFRHDPVWP